MYMSKVRHSIIDGWEWFVYHGSEMIQAGTAANSEGAHRACKDWVSYYEGQDRYRNNPEFRRMVEGARV